MPPLHTLTCVKSANPQKIWHLPRFCFRVEPGFCPIRAVHLLLANVETRAGDLKPLAIDPIRPSDRRRCSGATRAGRSTKAIVPNWNKGRW